MASSKKIIAVTTHHTSDADALCAAMSKKFVDPTGTPYFQFTIVDGHLCAEGDAWAKKANERPAMGTMASFAEGYVWCLQDASDAPIGR